MNGLEKTRKKYKNREYWSSEKLLSTKFNRLSIIKELNPIINKNGTKTRLVQCLCECGVVKNIRLYALVNGASKSFGCYCNEVLSDRFKKMNYKHGLFGIREQRLWSAMKTRCSNKNTLSYRWYGGRGISVCKSWQESFMAFYNDMGECPKGMTLDRIDVNGNYEPSNCRWATTEQQANNKTNTIYITANGQKKTMKEWANELNIKVNKLYYQYRRGEAFAVSLLMSKLNS